VTPGGDPTDERIEVGQPHAILRDGKPVGVVVAAVEEEGRCKAVLEEAGYKVEAAEHREGVFELGGECDIEKPRECEVEIVLGRISELADETQTPTTEIDALAERPFTEDEAKAAAEAVVGRMPDGEQKDDARMWIDVAWGEEPAGA